MKIGAGTVAAERLGVKEIIDPKPYAVGSLIDTFKQYPHLDHVLPAMGYGEEQLKDLEATINQSDADVVIIGTPIDLNRVFYIEYMSVSVFYILYVLT